MAYELTEQKKVGLGLLGFGILFTFLGVVLFFDRGLLALGNIFWLTGVALLLGWRSTWNLFTSKANIKGSVSFLLGLFFLFVRWPIVGIILEIYGCLNLFGRFWPSVKAFLYEVPILGWIIRFLFCFKKMKVPELSLGPTQLGFNKSNSSSRPLESAESNTTCKKRKFFQDHHLKSCAPSPSLQTSVDLQLKDPLPVDWEQCLDLKSGKMYYLNRKTSRKSWNWPMKQASVNLELNISTLSGSSSGSRFNRSSETIEEAKNNNCNYDGSGDGSNNINMVALACRKCHLLVILSKSSPCCPNCKYVHSLST